MQHCKQQLITHSFCQPGFFPFQIILLKQYNVLVVQYTENVGFYFVVQDS